jgi:3-hydroxyacyl-CoA dehydrogenase
MGEQTAVIGAGVMGLATARALKRRGHDVVVYEQFQRGHARGSSHGRSRIFRLAYAEEEYVRLAQESLALWRELEAETGETLLELHGLLEIVRALETDDETLAACVEVGKRMGKEVVVVKESPGFITSRINAMIGNEAFYMLQEGVASAEDIDKAVKLGLNHPMGPLALADFVGLDTCLFIAEVLHRELGDDKYRPAPILRQYVAAGWVGRKAGRGFYTYG